LDKCNRKKVLKPFLKGIIPKISFPDNLESIKFSMQETPADKAKKSKTKYVVGISPEINGGEKKNSVDKKMEKKVNFLSKKYEKELDKHEREKTKIEKLIDDADRNIKKLDLPKNFQELFGKNEITNDKLQYAYDVVFRGSRPDAMIWCNDFAILIENKIYGGQIPSQIKRHKKSLEGGVEEIKKSWIKDIYPEIKRIEKGIDVGKKKQEQESKDSFLLKEFREYLEAIELTPFVGFKEEDFLDEEKMNNKIEKLGAAVAEELKKSSKGKYLKYSGRRKNGWYAFSESKKMSNEVNFSIYQEGLEFCVQLHLKINGEFGKRLKEELENDRGREDFDKILIELPDGDYYSGEITIMGLEEFQRQYTGDLYTVVTKYVKKNAYKGGKTYHERVEVRLKTIREMIIANVKEKKPSWFKIDYKIQAQKAEEKGADIIKDIVSIITKDLWPMYEFIVKE